MRTLTKLCSKNESLNYHNVLNLKLVQDEYIFKYSKEKKQNGTIESYLLSLTHFMNFLKQSIERLDAESIVIVDTDKFPTEKLLVLESKVSKWRESLRGEANEWQIEVYFCFLKLFFFGQNCCHIRVFSHKLLRLNSVWGVLETNKLTISSDSQTYRVVQK